MLLRLALCGALVAPGLPAGAQSVIESSERPALRDAQFRGGMPQMAQIPAMPGMMAPMPGGSQGSMGGGMAMVMTGETMGEMMAGACAAGVFIGGVAAVAAGPASAAVLASSAGIGCGLAVAATAAGMAGMMGWRAAYDSFK
ncbi:MAG TPA: hypothetical protein VGQ90_06610 [Stellaceae bacterium]|nr:hypothetical protein [Stellaceae bacterium]